MRRPGTRARHEASSRRGLAKALTRTAGVAVVALAAFTLRCASAPTPLPPWEPVPEPDPAEVACVVFLAGDAGEFDASENPLLARLRVDILDWADRLGRDSAVVMLFLGDNVYPEGVRPPGHDRRSRDVDVLTSQALVADPPGEASPVVPVLFVAGNHDYGQMRGEEALERIRNEAAVFDTLRLAGHNVALLPPPGEPVPGVVDMPCGVRLVLLDTAWWLTLPPASQRSMLLDSIRAVFESAGNRDIVLAGHHPFVSAGPHGGLVSLWRTVFVLRLLSRSGALVQDLNSPPYRALRTELIRIFRATRTPVLYAGGHDHNLQVIQRAPVDVPRYTLISGAASKMQGVDYIEGLRFRASRPGYMRLVFTRDGAVYVFVTAGNEDAVSCTDDDPNDRARCMAAAVGTYETAFSARLK